MASIPAQLPNAISAVRIALVPAWVVVAEAANRAAEIGGESAGTLRAAAAATLLSIGVSDVIDGYLARRFRLESHVGATLDAIADKLAQVVLFTYFALRPGPAFAAVPVWFLALLVARDVTLLVGCALVRWRAGAVRVVHRAHGKLASVLLFALLVVFHCEPRPLVTTAFLLMTAAVVAASTVAYVRDGVRQYAAATP